MDFKQVEPAVKQYIKRINKKLPVKEVILFGSYAEGKATKDSDVDLIILSNKFLNMDEDKRLRILYRNSVGFPYDLHVYGFTTQEFASVSPLTTLGEIRTKGIRIA